MAVAAPEQVTLSTTVQTGAERWRLACRAATLCAIDPSGLGGTHVRARNGPARDKWLDGLRRATSPAPLVKTNSSVPDDRLIGGLDLAGTLAAGRPVLEPGLMARADGGLLVVSNSETMPRGTAARIAAALDAGVVAIARDGVSTSLPARFGAVLIDEGDAEDAAPPAVLLDRLAFRLCLDGLSLADIAVDHMQDSPVTAARAVLTTIGVQDSIIAALCEAAAAFGISSPRAVLLALRAARAIAALDGRAEIDGDAVREAAVLVLGPRAISAPAPSSEEDNTPEEPPEPFESEEGQTPPEPPGTDNETADANALTESVVDAVRAALPADLLAGLLSATAGAGAGGGRAANTAPSVNRGRQIGARPGAPRGGARLDVLATLRSAAPWQRLRGVDVAARSRGGDMRIAIRREDFRIRRFEEASETVTIFMVDASGSAALHRLGEAKGAVELLLADCYVRRDSVALIAFRGTASTIELPPTRSLTRAKRALSGLPGGGGTPLAHALLQAGQLARDAQRRGVSPAIVMLTDCRTNVALDGAGGRARAETDALDAARVLARAGLPVLLVDTSPRPQPFAAVLKGALRARYLPLPYSDSRVVADAARALTGGAAPAISR